MKLNAVLLDTHFPLHLYRTLSLSLSTPILALNGSLTTLLYSRSSKDTSNVDYTTNPNVLPLLSHTTMFSILLSTFLLLPSVLGHFKLVSPPARGFDEDTLGTFPCGGQDSVAKTRTPWPLKGGPIQLDMEHDRVLAQVLLGLGNNPGSSFNIVLQKTVQQEGIGDFCFGDVVSRLLPSFEIR